ncbi:hypothetical protein Tco_1551385, partial [Tanacetum coccineum]
DRIPHDLSKPLPLHSALGRFTIPVHFFFNKDLEYLTNENVEKKYATSLTKLKAARYDLEGNKELIPQLWSSTKILSIIRLSIDKQFRYGYLKEIFVRHVNQKEYTFKEADFQRLHLNDIEDMYLLIMIQQRVEDVQLGVESYQTKLNLMMPQVKCVDDELYKFRDRTLKKVHDQLDYMLHNFVLEYNEGMPKRVWTEKDQRRAISMLKEIEKTLLKTQIMRSLECFVGGRRIEMDYKLLTRTE